MSESTKTKSIRASAPSDAGERQDLRAYNQAAPSAFYEDESVTVYHGDSRMLLGLMPSVDHVITDPPFEAEAHTLQRRVQRKTNSRAEYGRVVAVEPLEFQPIRPWERAFTMDAFGLLARRWVLVFCQIEGAPLWRACGETSGLAYKRTCLWIKPDGMPQLTGDRPGMGYEAFVAMHRPGRSQWNGGGRHGVYVVPKGSDGLVGGNDHPTQKPLQLIVDLVRDFTDEGDTILDPFAGSGTTGVAAKLNGRKAILIEKSEQYCEVAAKRLRETEPGRLFDRVPRAKAQRMTFEEPEADPARIAPVDDGTACGSATKDFFGVEGR